MVMENSGDPIQCPRGHVACCLGCAHNPCRNRGDRRCPICRAEGVIPRVLPPLPPPADEESENNTPAVSVNPLLLGPLSRMVTQESIATAVPDFRHLQFLDRNGTCDITMLDACGTRLHFTVTRTSRTELTLSTNDVVHDSNGNLHRDGLNFKMGRSGLITSLNKLPPVHEQRSGNTRTILRKPRKDGQTFRLRNIIRF